jgi:hypothetical protein
MVYTYSLVMIFLIIDDPRPTSKLNSGPAILPAIPISPYPDLASAQFKLKSGAELPKLSSVIPRKAVGILNKTPKRFNKSTRTFAVIHIQKTAIVNENRHRGYFRYIAYYH